MVISSNKEHFVTLIYFFKLSEFYQYGGDFIT